MQNSGGVHFWKLDFVMGCKVGRNLRNNLNKPTYLQLSGKGKKFPRSDIKNKSLIEYVAQFRHLEYYCPKVFSSEYGRAGKFAWGFNEGLRPRMISRKLETLSEVVEMATRLDEDYAHTSDAMKRRENSLVSPRKFKKTILITESI